MYMKEFIAVLAGLIVTSTAGAATTDADFLSTLGQGKQLSLLFSPYTHHTIYDSKHRPVIMLGLEREYPDAKIDGAALFTNSFGQPTVYVYPWGQTYHAIYGIDKLSFKWTAGLMYGYRQPYENKVPLNYKGLSPVIIPALSYEFMPGWNGQLNVLGTAGVMFQVSRTIP